MTSVWRNLIGTTVILLCFGSCSKDEHPSYSYLALGDSYTIGQGVDEDERWPVQLAQRLTAEGTTVMRPNIIARTGWKTSALLSVIEQQSDLNTGVDLVSLLIGVNNQFAGRTVESFAPEFEELLNKAITLARDRRDRVFVLSIPDYGATLSSQSRAEVIGRSIDEYNAVCRRICEEYGILYFDITPISRLAKDDVSLLAPDNLHPSGIMYGQWVDLILKDVKALLD